MLPNEVHFYFFTFLNIYFPLFINAGIVYFMVLAFRRLAHV